MFKDRSGNVALIFGLLAPLVLAFVGAGVDYARYNSIRDTLQDIADSAALAGARQYSIAAGANTVPKVVAKQIADSGIANFENGAGAVASVTANEHDTTVTVAIKHVITPTFLVGAFKNPLNLTVDATAQAVGGANICVIALNPDITRAIYMDGTSTLSGSECAIYSNSIDPKGLWAKDSAVMKTVLNCSAGGYEGSVDNFDPSPLTDCPPRDDPLADRPAPAAGSCSFLPNLIKDITTVLSPAVYCGGLTIDGTADVTLNPGVYVIRDGELLIDGSARVTGEGVAFFFEGNSTFRITSNAVLSLSAPTDGEMAGLLMFQDRTANKNRAFQISSQNAEKLVGTIYLPRGRLTVDADAEVAADSEYTAIIAETIHLTNSVNLVLNSDYSATDVPVPEGIANAGGSVRLRR